jgi:hypothetical protein
LHDFDTLDVRQEVQDCLRKLAVAVSCLLLSRAEIQVELSRRVCRALKTESNSLDAQREASEAYIRSQTHEADRWFAPAMTMDRQRDDATSICPHSSGSRGAIRGVGKSFNSLPGCISRKVSYST